MTITLYKNTSEKERISKTLTGAISKTGTLRTDTSLIDPVITVTSTTNLSSYNYLYIPSFGRYYFITDITVVKNNLWQLTCHCDVLMSWKSQILQQQVVVDRQNTFYNLYLPDTKFIVDARRRVQTYPFPYKFGGQHSYVIAFGGVTADASASASSLELEVNE